ncbi:MAG: TIGR03619 family F420-dependent LLM class oxidoreductase, partial [Acidimicrobiales bacterium]
RTYGHHRRQHSGPHADGFTIVGGVMKFGFVLPNNWGLDNVNDVVDIAAEAEALGLDSVWVNHHILNVGYIEDRLDDRPYHDALTVLAAAAVRTERVKLGTSVLVLPYLHPMALAKTLATIDQLSGGRVIAGLGVGSLPEENEALGVIYEDRGRYADESIEVMSALWTQREASVPGEYFTLDGIKASPKPQQQPLPIWIGGAGGPARRRAARHGHGWHPMCSVTGLARRMPKLVAALEAEGRSRDDITVAPRILTTDVPDRASVQA